MSETQEPRGLRALPPAMLVAFTAWLALECVRIVFLFTAKDPWTSTRMSLISEGVSFANEVLLVISAFELARRATGPFARGLFIAGCALVAALVLDVAFGLTSALVKMWEHEWLYKVTDYAFYCAWLPVPIGLAIANWRERRVLAIVVAVVFVVTWPPPFASKAFYSWLPSGKGGYAISLALTAVRMASFLAAFAAVARGRAGTDRTLAVDGLRLAARALWLRVIAAVGLVLLTLMAVAGSGGEGSFAMLKLAMMTASIINIVAFTQFGIGAVRAGRAELTDLGRWPLVISGATSLWAAGVTLTQLGWLYKMFYGSTDSYDRSAVTEYAQSLSIVMPIVVTVGVGLLAVAIGGLAARLGNEDLRTDAQAKGAGFVALTLVSVAIQSWMLPKATSLGSFAGLSLLAAGAGLWATVLMARLCAQAADELGKEPGLPTASIVSDGT
jgi:hypothetical protein